jgi:hypothetical protein
MSQILIGTIISLARLTMMPFFHDIGFSVFDILSKRSSSILAQTL